MKFIMSRISCFLVSFIFLGLVSFAQSNEEEKKPKEKKEVSAEILQKSSRISWTGYKPLGEHKGEIEVKQGNLLFVDTLLTGGEVVVDMTSITCTDIEDAENNTKLVGHLKSDDFFQVDSFSTAKLTIKKVIPYGPYDTKDEKITANLYKGIADLTIKGITKEVKFRTKLYKYNDEAGYVSASVRVNIDRSDFDVKYGSGSFFDNLGDKIIYDEFRLDVSLSARLK